LKGQYLAVETVLTFAMGISLALGTTTMFNDYSEDVASSSMEKESQVVRSEIQNSIFHLKSSDRGSIEVNLPEEIGGRDYRLAIDREILVLTRSERFSSKLDELNKYNYSGTVNGGSVNIYKTGNNIILRPA